ncbi:hypothetical protein [Methylorubrum thiocyanatum]|uniref:hypothetical protein n=1 Tax=Methylorubrum thiocyanatum TaxID=47958 RepID=UPI00398C82A3
MSRVLSPAEADRRFFRRLAHRRHRIRIAGRCEIETARQKGALTVTPPEGFRIFVGTRSDGRGRLWFVVGIMRSDCDTDMGEADARGAFGLLSRQDDTKLTAWVSGKREAPHA